MRSILRILTTPDGRWYSDKVQGCVVPFVIIIGGIAGAMIGFGKLLVYFV